MTDPTDAAANMPDALEVAAAQDAQFARTGRLVGPLHGVVMAIKDQYDTFDMRTTSGADVHYANDRPPDDATFVKRLREAGAIILAKANLAEYAVDGARSSFGGTFCNPYDTEREPGMSSAGSASSVAANLVTCAIGEETVVSIRWPASVNSLVGIAPTEELVSRDGMMGVGLNMRTGPICRTVAGRGEDSRRDRRLRPEGRADGLQRRPEARAAVCGGSGDAAARRPSHRRDPRVHEQDALLEGGRGKHRHSSSARSMTSASSVRRSSIPDRKARCSRAVSRSTRRSC